MRSTQGLADGRGNAGMKQIKVMVEPFMMPRICASLRQIDEPPQFTVWDVMEWRAEQDADPAHTVLYDGCEFTRKSRLEMVVPSTMVDEITTVLADAARTGGSGDGRIFITDVAKVQNMRTDRPMRTMTE